MKQWFLKRKILKILNENPDKWYHSIEIGERTCKVFFNRITFAKWFDIRKALTSLKKEGKIIEDTRCSIFKIERRYSHDRFLYK